MRGAARIGGRAFRPTPSSTPNRDFNPLEAIDLVGDLPVAPVLEPINDEWSWSIGAEPADPRDCARYPASPYCGEIPLEFGKPFGFTPEIKTNGCETCLYVYPVILWLKTTPQVICHRDPKCDVPKPPLNKDELTKHAPKPFDENVQPNKYKSPECALRERITNYFYNRQNEAAIRALTVETDSYYDFQNITVAYAFTVRRSAGTGEIVDATSLELHLAYPIAVYDTGAYIYHYVGDLVESIVFTRSVERRAKNSNDQWETFTSAVNLINWKPIPCPDRPRPPKKLPPPPFPPFNDRIPINRKNGNGKGGDMCCNDCADSKDNTEKLLREIKEIKKALGTGKLDKALNAAVGIGDGSVTTIVNLIARRLGTSAYPIEVPESLLTGTDDGKVFRAESNAEYLFWLTKQLDGLVGEFPIQIEVKDIDPLTKGDQKQKIEIPNLAEAVAEIYGLVAKGAINQEVDQAFLLRIATEVIAAKNGIAITQDYVKANAKFLGYKGNPVDREMQYNFDFSKIVLGQKDQDVRVDEILQTVKGYVKGWENQDKETAANFFMKLMFSAGIIKSVFFRNKKQMAEVIDKADEMLKDRLKVEDNWKDFLRDVNNPTSQINKNQAQPPDIKEENP
jgi:hypothetical protein